MSDYPSEWSVRPLGEITERVRRTSTDQNLDVLTISSTEGWVDQKRKWARDMAGKSIEKYTLLQQGEFSYNRGNSKTYPQGCVFRLGSWNRALVPNIYHSFSITSPDIDDTYLKHFFSAGGLNDQLRSVITSSVRDNGLLNITAETFFASEIPVPPLPEQKKIAEILSGIDESIHIHQQKIEDLSTLLRELLREHYQERCENSDLHLEKVIRLPIQYGANASATKLQSGEPRYIRITDIKEDGALNELNAVGIDLPANEWNNYLLREGDLLLARTGNTIGKSYLHKRTNEELVFAGYLLRVALDQEAYRPEYLFLFTQSDIYKNWISETSRTGAQPNINAKEYGAMPIPYSSISEQDAFIGRAMSLRRSKSILSNKVDKLKMLKQAISADLLSGRKRVSI